MIVIIREPVGARYAQGQSCPCRKTSCWIERDYIKVHNDSRPEPADGWNGLYLIALGVEQAWYHVFIFFELYLFASYAGQAPFWNAFVQYLQ